MEWVRPMHIRGDDQFMKWVKSHPIIALVLALWLSLMLIASFTTDDPDASPMSVFMVALLLGVIGAWLLTLLSNATVGRSKRNRKTEEAPNKKQQLASGEAQPIQVQVPTPVVPQPQSVKSSQFPPSQHHQQEAGDSTASISAYQTTSHETFPPKIAQNRGGNITLKELLSYTPTEFEEFCAKALNSMGYQDMKRTGGAGDLQADIIGKDIHGRSTIVQCKRYKPGTKIGSPVIQSFIGMKSVHHRADRGIFVTTAEYSNPAIRLAQQHDVVLIDGDDLVKIAGLVFVPRVEARPKYQVRYCSNCGSEIEGHEVRFCSECGSPIRR